MIVGSRIKATFNLSLATGWQVERFRREGKSMKALADYLDPPTEQQRSDAGAHRVLAAFQRMAEKQRQ